MESLSSSARKRDSKLRLDEFRNYNKGRNNNSDSLNNSICSDDTKALLPKNTNSDGGNKISTQARKANKFIRSKKMNKLSRALFRGSGNSGNVKGTEEDKNDKQLEKQHQPQQQQQQQQQQHQQHQQHQQQPQQTQQNKVIRILNFASGKQNQNQHASSSSAQSTESTQPETPQRDGASPASNQSNDGNTKDFDFSVDFAKFVESSIPIPCLDGTDAQINPTEIANTTKEISMAMAQMAMTQMGQMKESYTSNEIVTSIPTEKYVMKSPETPSASELKIRPVEQMERVPSNTNTNTSTGTSKSSRSAIRKVLYPTGSEIGNTSHTGIGSGTESQGELQEKRLPSHNLMDIFDNSGLSDSVVIDENIISNASQTREIPSRKVEINISYEDNINESVKSSSTAVEKFLEAQQQKSKQKHQEQQERQHQEQQLPGSYTPNQQRFRTSCSDFLLSNLSPRSSERFSDKFVALEAGWGGIRTLLSEKLTVLEESVREKCDTLCIEDGVSGAHRFNTRHNFEALRSSCLPGACSPVDDVSYAGVEMKLEVLKEENLSTCDTENNLLDVDGIESISGNPSDEEDDASFMKENAHNISAPKCGIQDDLKDLSSIAGNGTDEEGGVIANEESSSNPQQQQEPMILTQPENICDSADGSSDMFFETNEWFVAPSSIKARGHSDDDIMWSPETIKMKQIEEHSNTSDSRRGELKNHAACNHSPTSVMMMEI